MQLLSSIIFFIVGVFVSPAGAQEAPTPNLNPFYANQTARDVMAHGITFYTNAEIFGGYGSVQSTTQTPFTPFTGAGSLVTSDQAIALSASEFISNYVAQRLLFNETITNTPVHRGALMRARVEFNSFLEMFKTRTESFLDNPRDPSALTAFKYEILSLRDFILTPILDADFALSHPTIQPAEIQKLLPLFDFTHEAVKLIERIEADKSKKINFDSQLEEFREMVAKVQPELELNASMSDIVYRAITRLTTKYDAFFSEGPLDVKKIDQLRSREAIAFKTAFYQAFAQAIESYNLTAKQQKLVLEGFGKIHPTEKVPSYVLKNEQINHLPHLIEEYIQRVGFRFLQTILSRRLDNMNGTSEGVRNKVFSKMTLVNNALALDIGATKGEHWWSRAGDAVRAAELNSLDVEHYKAYLRALEIIRTVLKR